MGVDDPAAISSPSADDDDQAGGDARLLPPPDNTTPATTTNGSVKPPQSTAAVASGDSAATTKDAEAAEEKGDAAPRIVPRAYKRRWVAVFLFATYSMTNAYQWIHLNIIGNVILRYYNSSLPGGDYQKEVRACLSFMHILSIRNRLDGRKCHRILSYTEWL